MAGARNDFHLGETDSNPEEEADKSICMPDSEDKSTCPPESPEAEESVMQCQPPMHKEESMFRRANLEGYGAIVEVKHPNSLWRRDIFYERRGLRLEVRPMTPDDDLRETAFFNSMSMKERVLRFLGMKTQLLPDEVRMLTHLDFDQDFAIVAVDRATDSLAGIARYCRDREDPKVAEAAVAVLQKYQRLGIARYLVSVLFSAAKEHGIVTLTADILRENRASRELFEKVAKEAGAKKILKEADFELFTYHFTFPADGVCGPENSRNSEGLMTPSNFADESDASPPSFKVDCSRHPRSVWRKDLIFESGLRLDVRPADPDDEVRVRYFAQKLEAAGDTAAVEDLTRIDFTTGFQLVALDCEKDILVGAAHYHRGQDTFSLKVLVDPDYRGLGLSDYLTTQVMRAAEKDVVRAAKAS